MSVVLLLALAEQWYRGGNPYHNGIHACDVTQALSCLISTEKVCVLLIVYRYLMTSLCIIILFDVVTYCVNILTSPLHICDMTLQ